MTLFRFWLSVGTNVLEATFTSKIKSSFYYFCLHINNNIKKNFFQVLYFKVRLVELIFFNGGWYRTRTYDLLHVKQAL